MSFLIDSSIACAILAGGKNSRMGRDKAFLQVGGVPIIQRTLALLKGISEEVIIVTNSPRDYSLYKKDSLIVADIIKDAGPLGGIHSALSHTSKKSVFFIACDMPFLHNDIITRQFQLFNKTDCDAFIPRIGGFIEPLHAIYKSKLKNNLSLFIKKSDNYSIRRWLEAVNVSYFDLEGNADNKNIFKNINTPYDLDILLCRDRPLCLSDIIIKII
ncbi:MAG: molybdenum cofactor guanylyltransferase [Candidatus Omnitrophota bacterium]